MIAWRFHKYDIKTIIENDWALIPLNHTDPSGLSPYDQYKAFFTDKERQVLRKNKISPLRVAELSKYALDVANRVGAENAWQREEIWQGRIDAFRHTF